MFRSLFAGVALAVSASEATAQITTYVAPPRTPAPQLIATADSVRRDSIATTTMTNMKAWVDSAAGVAVPAHVGDTVVAAPVQPGTPVFTDGAVAPATASALPMVAFGSLVALGIGAALVTTRGRQ